MCHCSMDGKLLDLSWTLLGGEVKMVKWPAIIWFHWTPESIPLWSEFRCIQMIFRWYSWVWFSVVANHGEMLRCHLKTIHSGSFYRSIRDKQSPSETRKFKTELRKFTISKNIDNIHIESQLSSRHKPLPPYAAERPAVCCPSQCCDFRTCSRW